MSEETTQVYSPIQGELIDVPKAEESEYRRKGFKTGAEAELEAREHGWEGKLGTAAFNFGNAALFGLPKLALRGAAPSLAYESDQAAQANPTTALASDIAGGVAGFAALPTPSGAAGVATRVAASAFAGGTSSLDRAIADGDPHLAERMAQGIGIGGLFGLAGEGAGYVLAKAAPAFQRATGRMLERFSKNGAFEKIYQTGEQAQVASTLARDIDDAVLEHIKGPSAPSSTPSMGGAPFPAERPYAGLTQKPPPLPEQPFANATHVLEGAEGPEARIVADTELAGDVRKENALRASEREGYATRAAQRLGDEPLSTEDADALRSTYDKMAHDAAATSEAGELSGASDARAMRDSVPAGLAPDAIAKRTADIAAYNAPDPALEGAFARAGLDQQPTHLAELPEPISANAPVPNTATEIPRQSQYMPTSELPEPVASEPEVGPLATLRGPQPMKGIPLPKEPSIKALDRSRARSSELNSEPYKYGLKSKESLYTSNNFWRALNRTKDTELLGLPFTMGLQSRLGIGAATLGYHVAQDLSKRAQVAALNNQTAINYVVGNWIAPAIKGSAQVVRNLIQGSSEHVSNSYITGDVDKDYAAVTSGAQAIQANPQQVTDYYHQRYGAIDPSGNMTGALLAHVQNGVNVINASIPKDPRKPGLLDAHEPYDPPRSMKLRVLQTYTGVNNPFEALSAPTYHSVAAVAQVHPHTLSEVRQQIAQELADAKVRAKLTAQQKRDIGIVMGIPANWVNSPQGIASLASIGQPPQPTQGAPEGAKPTQKSPQLGGLGKSYVNNYAAPSQLNAVDPPGGF